MAKVPAGPAKAETVVRATLYVLVTSLGLVGRAQSVERFEDAGCHVAFQHPTDWGVQADTGQFAEPCSYIARPVAYDSLLIQADSVDVYSISIHVAEGSPDAVAETAGFAHRGASWVIQGRFGAETPGSPYSRADLTGVTGVAAAGCYRLGGAYVGACDAPAALVGTTSRSVAIRGGPRSEDAVALILSTLEILE